MQCARGKSASWSLSRRRATRIHSLQRKNVFEVRFLKLLLTLPRYGEWVHKNPGGGRMQPSTDRSWPTATHVHLLPANADGVACASCLCTFCYCVAGGGEEHTCTAGRSCRNHEAGQQSFRRAPKRRVVQGTSTESMQLLGECACCEGGVRMGNGGVLIINECPAVPQCPTAQEMHNPCSWLSQHQLQGSYYAPALTCLDAACAESAPSAARRGPSHRQQHQQQRQ